MAKVKETDTSGRPVIVTTAHRGVFFGYATETDGDQIALARARLWIVALHGDVVSDGEKFGALKREILAEVKLGQAEGLRTSPARRQRLVLGHVGACR